MQVSFSKVHMWSKAILLGLFAGCLLQSFIFERTIITGRSMMPTLLHDEQLIINKAIYLFREPRRGDLVVLCYLQEPGYEIIKRVIAVAGDTVAISDGVVYLNNQPLLETYTLEAAAQDFPQVSVPQGTVFVLGDNRNRSDDSRLALIGFIPTKNIIGSAILRLYPLDRFGWIE